MRTAVTTTSGKLRVSGSGSSRRAMGVAEACVLGIVTEAMMVTPWIPGVIVSQPRAAWISTSRRRGRKLPAERGHRRGHFFFASASGSSSPVRSVSEISPQACRRRNIGDAATAIERIDPPYCSGRYAGCMQAICRAQEIEHARMMGGCLLLSREREHRRRLVGEHACWVLDQGDADLISRTWCDATPIRRPLPSTAAGAARTAAASAGPAAGAEHGVARVMAFLDRADMHRSSSIIDIASRAEQVDTVQAGLIRADGDLGTAFFMETDVAAIPGVLLINNGDTVTVWSSARACRLTAGILTACAERKDSSEHRAESNR